MSHPLQGKMDEHYKRALAGEIDYMDYRATCPFKTPACAGVACEGCKYFIPMPDAPILTGKAKIQCIHCQSDELSHVTLYRPRVQLPCIDGMHERYEAGEKIYSRYLCDSCGLINDFEVAEADVGKDHGMLAASVQYASQVRAMHADIADRIDALCTGMSTMRGVLAGLLAIEQKSKEMR